LRKLRLFRLGGPHDQIPALLKADISTDGEACYIQSGGRRIEIDKRAYGILSRFAASTGHRGLPSGRLQVYKSDDKYLFRSVFADSVIDEEALVHSLKRFNQAAENTDRAITFRSLSKNALFERIYQDGAPGKITEKILKYFGCDAKTAYGIEKEYTQWKNAYYI